MKTALDWYKFYYKERCEYTCFEGVYEWAASDIFELATYDGSIDRLFVKKIIEVCKVILDNKTYEYISVEENYIPYLIVCQLLYNFNWIDWGTSIRGAWFNDYCLDRTQPILKPDSVLGPIVNYSKENLELLIKFIEETAENERRSDN